MSYLCTNSYGKKVYKAPAKKYLKAYLVDKDLNDTHHVLIDEYGLVLASFMNGWTSSLQHSKYYKLIPLPVPIERGNEFDNSSWDWAGWWTFNWKCDSWAWMH